MKTILIWWHLEGDMVAVCHVCMGQGEFSCKENQYSHILSFVPKKTTMTIFLICFMSRAWCILYSYYMKSYAWKSGKKFCFWYILVQNPRKRDCASIARRPWFKSCCRHLLVVHGLSLSLLPAFFPDVWNSQTMPTSEDCGEDSWEKAGKMHRTFLGKLQTIGHIYNSSYFVTLI